MMNLPKDATLEIFLEGGSLVDLNNTLGEAGEFLLKIAMSQAKKENLFTGSVITEFNKTPKFSFFDEEGNLKATSELFEPEKIEFTKILENTKN